VPTEKKEKYLRSRQNSTNSVYGAGIIVQQCLQRRKKSIYGAGRILQTVSTEQAEKYNGVYGAGRIVQQCLRSRQNSTTMSTEKREKCPRSRKNSTHGAGRKVSTKKRVKRYTEREK
jgi:hypothetical protein